MAENRKIKLTLSYDGSRYHGWQRQKNGLSIQEVLEDKISLMTRKSVRITGSGRTDAGVHAVGQVCHFSTSARLPAEVFKNGLNSLLPEDILVRRAEEAPENFHARYDAESKVYEYRILNREDPDVFLRAYTWHIARPLDLGAMENCLALLPGRRDFSSFRSAGSSNRNPVRRILRAELLASPNGLVKLVFEADGFLRHMVRNIVGTLVGAGFGKTTEAGFLGILNAMDRQRAGVKAPPEGLFLMSVRYPSPPLPGPRA